MDKKTHITVEMNDPNFRPAIAAKRDNMTDYDVIYVGFPIWCTKSILNKEYRP